MPPVDLQALRKRQPLLDLHSEAIASLACEITVTRGVVSEVAWQGFRMVSYDERQALDVILGASLVALCNSANSLA